jgi:AcrR family transcriptional regulator
MVADHGRSAEDLTARARIREAALQLFAERGIGAATIRDIAKAAGVSSGLVRHHFGSKEALRDACDAYALDRSNDIRQQIFGGGRLDDPVLRNSVPTAIQLQNYAVRSMMDGSPAAAARFEHMVRLGEDWLTEQGFTSKDMRAYSVVLVAVKLGAFLLRDQMSAALGADVRTPAGFARMNRGFIDLFANPLLTQEQAEQLYTAIDGLLADTPTTAGTDTTATKESA